MTTSITSSTGTTRIDEQRAAVVQEARTWLRTPYHNHGRVKGAGVDCAQLLIAVFEATGLVPAPDVGIYPPAWHLHRSEERYLEWVARYCVQVTEPAAGDIAMFRFGRCVSHGGIVSATHPELRMVHSFQGVGVLEEALLPRGPLLSRLHSYWTLTAWSA